MGRILTTEKLTQNNIQDYIASSTKNYSTFLKGTPFFCTYYSKESFNSTHDKSLLNVSEIIGADSPIKFNKIENFPLYGIETSSFSTSVNDFGVSGEVSSSAIILPRTVKPSADDVFIISYQSRERLFIITDVETDNINNDRYYKITFKLSQHLKEEVERQIFKKLTIDYSLIGKTENPIVEKDNYDLYLQLESIFDILFEEYKDRFFDNTVNLFSKKESNGLYFIDKYLNSFIIRNSLVTKYNSYRSFSYTDTELLKIGRTKEYNKSIYKSFEDWNFSKIDYTQKFSYKSSDNSRYSNDWFSKKTHFENFVNDNGNFFLTPTFILNFSKEEKPLEPCFRKFLYNVVTDFYNENSYKDIPFDIGTPDYDSQDYHLIPFVLFAIKKFRFIVRGKRDVDLSI